MLQAKPSFNRDVIPQQVYTHLRKLILDGVEFKAGDKINIDQLSNEWQISKTPIREALKNLEQTQLVKYLPRKGFFVTSLDWNELMEMADLRIALEVHALFRGYDRIDRERLKRLRIDFIKQHQVLTAAGEASPYLDADEKFHTFIAHSSGNKKLIEIYTTMRGTMKYMRVRDTFHSNSEMGATLPEHLAIIDAILADQREMALKLMQEHLINVYERLKSNNPHSVQSY